MAHSYCLSLCLPTVRALILEILPEPNNPIEDTGTSCLSAEEKAVGIMGSLYLLWSSQRMVLQ